MRTFIEAANEKLNSQLKTFNSMIDDYKVTLGLDDLKVTQLKKAGIVFDYSMGASGIFNSFGEAVNAWRLIFRYDKHGVVLTAFPTIPTLGEVPELTPPNLQKMFADLIQDCVNSPNFNPTIAKALGILAPETPFVPGDGKPNLTGKLATGGHPLLHATMGDFEAFLIQKDSGSGYADLSTAMHPDQLDHSALPPTGKSEVWKYRAIYFYKGEIVGHYSDEIIITVYGY
jgi:hypothetical protein